MTCETVQRDRIAPVLAAMGDYRAQATQAEQTVTLANSVACETREQYALCGQFLQQAQAQFKYFEGKRKKLTRPFLDCKREVDGWFTPITKAMATVKQVLASKIQAYDQRAAVAQRAALDAIEQAHQQGNQPAVEHHASQLTETPALPGVHKRNRWTFRVTDLGRVPRGFLVLDDRAVRNAIKSGARNVPGLEIYEVESLVARG